MCSQQLLLVGWKKAAAQLPLASVAVLALSVLWKAQEMQLSLQLEGWKATAEDRAQKIA